MMLKKIVQLLVVALLCCFSVISVQAARATGGGGGGGTVGFGDGSDDGDGDGNSGGNDVLPITTGVAADAAATENARSNGSGLLQGAPRSGHAVTAGRGTVAQQRVLQVKAKKAAPARPVAKKPAKRASGSRSR